MKNYYIIFLSIAILYITFPSVAQQGWTVYNSTNSILSSTPYRAISIDQSGNIWVGGSYSGLFKFDGITWTEYNTINSNILDEDINDILVDNSDKVWVANYKGISVFDGITFTNYDTTNAEFGGKTVYTLGKDNSGKIWISSRNGSFNYEGITTFDGTTWTNITGYPSQINGACFSDYAFTSNNDAWLACNNGLAKYNGTFTYYPPVTSLSVSHCVAVDANENIWAGGYHALVKYDGSEWTKFDNVSDLGIAEGTLYNDMFPDGSILWIGCSSGFLKFNMNTGQVITNFNSTNSPLGDNCVSRIAKDADGYLWLSTNIGIVKMDPAIVGVEVLNSNNRYILYGNPSDGIFNFLSDCKTKVKYGVYSLEGKLISLGTNTTGIFQVNLTGAPGGLYFVHVVTENSNNQTFKLIKY